jgi:serine/threonine protein phosphatase PrpC
LSLSKKYNNTNVAKSKIQKKKGKRPFTGLIKLKTNKIKDELKTGKPSYTKEIRHTKKNSLKYLDNNNNNIDYSSLTSSDNRYRNKDFISRYNKHGKISTNIKTGRETIQRQNNSNNLYNIINNDYSNRNIKNIIKENRKKINQSHRRFFRVNKIENNNLKELNSINNNDMSKEKKNTSIVNNKRKVLGNSNNHSTSNFNIKNNKRINIIMNEDLKKYFFKGKSTPKENTNQKKNNKIFIISNKNKLKSKPKTQKDNSKNTIPKPITSKIDLKLAKIPEDNNLYNEDLLKYIERRANTSLTNYKEKNDENKIVENNYIDNALINIRGVSIPGKDTQNQIKLNTDSYIIKRDINNIKNFNIFGIFDGHGFYGHTISVYVKENLFRKIVDHPAIQNLKNLNDIYNQFKKNNFKIINDIFNEIDYQLLYQKNDFDIKLSGSTCNIIIQIGDHIICANTGDSRAIIVYENKTNNYQALSLSYDCKPDLPKEKERILKKGGIITALKDSFQEAKGSLRVFMKGNSLPGLPMSRSFGDKLGKDIGIIVDPLINEYILNKDVKYIIMASDGIWEFLNNEQVMTIGNKYYMNNDPDTFCQILIKKSTELWEKNSRNIDDITLIVIYFTFL